jgi:hypothetical protein
MRFGKFETGEKFITGDLGDGKKLALSTDTLATEEGRETAFRVVGGAEGIDIKDIQDFGKAVSYSQKGGF